MQAQGQGEDVNAGQQAVGNDQQQQADQQQADDQQAADQQDQGAATTSRFRCKPKASSWQSWVDQVEEVAKNAEELGAAVAVRELLALRAEMIAADRVKGSRGGASPE